MIDVGSFAEAARKLNRATSVISYTITKIESQPGVMLFERGFTRRPRLTKEAARCRKRHAGLQSGARKGQGLHQGLEPEAHLAFDVMLPASRVIETLLNFQDTFSIVGRGPWHWAR